MAEFPALPLWTDAYIGDTTHLTNEEHGVYLRLLMFAWRSPDCSLPSDDKRLAIMVGVTPKKWAKLKPTIMAFWTFDEGVYRQKKLTKERRFVSNSRAQKSAAGKASAKAKSLETQEPKATSVRTGEPTGTPTGGQQPTPTPTPTPISGGRLDESNPPPPAAADSDLDGLLAEVAGALGYGNDGTIPKAWTNDAAKKLVRGWLNAGLSGDQIVERARKSREVHPEPPASPKALVCFMQTPAARKDEPRASFEDQVKFWAERINSGVFIAQSSIRPSTARAMIEAGLVTKDKLRERGIAA